MKHGLGAVEAFGRLAENFQGVFFHKVTIRSSAKD
jgi:hypothetical protein